MKAVLVVIMLSLIPIFARASSCDAVNALGTTIQVTHLKGDAEGLDLRAGGASMVLPGSGPGNECIEISVFRASKIIVVRYRAGALGTRQLTERELAATYRFNAQRLTFLREFELKRIEEDSRNRRHSIDRSLSLREIPEGIQVQLIEKNGAVQESVVLK